MMQYKQCRAEIARLDELIQEQDDLCSGLSSPQLDSERVQSSHNPDRMGEVIAKKSDLQDRRMDEVMAAIDTMNQITDIINAIGNVDHQRLLWIRYIEKYRNPNDPEFGSMTEDERAARMTPWEVIADEMHYSSRWILIMHGRALQEVERIMDDG